MKCEGASAAGEAAARRLADGGPAKGFSGPASWGEEGGYG